MISKPMLAGKCLDVAKLKYPVYVTPKLDGIRALMIDGKLVSRNFKSIPNNYIRKTFEDILPDNIDGELILNGEKESGAEFGKTTSAVMSEDGEPDVKYYAFDYVKGNISKPYTERILDLQKSIKSSKVIILSPVKINNEKELLKYEAECLAKGYEGVMIRSGDGPYKCGRSTEREGYLLKLKRFEDSEAEIIGFEEQMSNQNEAEEDAFGRTKRSQAKAGMVAADTLGHLIVKDVKSGIDFGVGSGLNDAIRDEIWKNKKKYMGKIIKYKFQPYGVKEKPRLPIFLGFREKGDM